MCTSSITLVDDQPKNYNNSIIKHPFLNVFNMQYLYKYHYIRHSWQAFHFCYLFCFLQQFCMHFSPLLTDNSHANFLIIDLISTGIAWTCYQKPCSPTYTATYSTEMSSSTEVENYIHGCM